MAILLISILGCFGKKKPPQDLQTWLDIHFPGQLEIVHHVVDLNPKNIFYKEKSTIVALKEDPETQFKIVWSKDQDSLGITQEEVITSIENSKRDVADARKIFDALQVKVDSKIAVGVIDIALYVLVFEEPTPETRKRILDRILPAISDLSDVRQTRIWIECMEPDIYGKEYNHIVPYGYWHQGDNFHRDKTIMALEFDWSDRLDTSQLTTQWAINTASDRSIQYMEHAYGTAEAWAAKNISGNVYLESKNMVMVEPDPSDPLAIRFHFPYFNAKPDTEAYGYENDILGYVYGIYQTDLKTFTQLNLKDAH